MLQFLKNVDIKSQEGVHHLGCSFSCGFFLFDRINAKLGNIGGDFMVRVNGEDVLADSLVLKDFLEDNGYQFEKIAVEVNGDIVPKAQYTEKVLKRGDLVEIVRFVGGG